MINWKKLTAVTLTILCIGGLFGCGNQTSDAAATSENSVAENQTSAQSSEASNSKDNSKSDIDSLILKYKNAEAVPTPATSNDLQGYWVSTLSENDISMVAVIDDNMVCYGYNPKSDSCTFEEYKVALDNEGWLHSIYSIAYEQNSNLSILDASATAKYYVSGNPDTLIVQIVLGDEWYTLKKITRDEFLKTVNEFMPAVSNPDAEVYFKY